MPSLLRSYISMTMGFTISCVHPASHVRLHHVYVHWQRCEFSLLSEVSASGCVSFTGAYFLYMVAAVTIIVWNDVL